ncbi:MAG TPA: ABC transporter ATP-binding protein [Acidimicrobiales bacterium]
MAMTEPGVVRTGVTDGRAATGAPPLEAVDLYRFYHAGDDETLALRGVSLRVGSGEVVAVTGPSGSGKSTLLACLAGVDEPDGGMVRVGGRAMSRRPEAERAALRASQIGVVYQAGNLIDHLTVRQNLHLVQRLAGEADPARSAAVLEEVGLAHRVEAAPATLSGGEAARAGLAVALVNYPSVLLADEPTGELDQVTSRAIVGLLLRRAALGLAVVIATHDPTVAAAADRQLGLREGRIEQ